MCFLNKSINITFVEPSYIGIIFQKRTYDFFNMLIEVT